MERKRFFCKGIRTHHQQQTAQAPAGRPAADQLHRTAVQESGLLDAVETIAESLESTLSPGPYHRLLPEPCRRRVTMKLFDVQRFRTWLASRNVWELPHDDRRLDAVRAALSGHV